jgi:RHS repeat-associated protein
MRVGHKSFVIFSFFSLISLAGRVPAAAQGWANGCLYRRAITIDHTKVPNTDQANFPVLISGTYSYLATTANGGNVTNANGYDILFASDANGVNPLSFEQESYNPSTGAIVYWVKLPTVSHTADTVFYLFYGNSSISTDQSNKNAVWDTSYKGVWHLPNGTSLSGTDSTSNGYTLTNNNGTAATAGKVDGAASFNGSNNYLSNSSLSISSGSSITISFWNYVTSSQLQSACAFTIGAADNPNRIVASAPWSDGTLYWDYGSWANGGRLSTSYSSYLGSWTHVVLEYNASNTTHYIYLNGSLATSSVNSNAPQALQSGIDIGAWPSYYHHGNMDEFRVSTIARSADWIATEYSNQNSPSTFYSVGSAAQGTMTLSITQLSPSTANLGDSVLMQGTNFGAAQGSSTVSLNGTSAVVRAWNNTAIDVIVPLSGSSGYFTVTVGGQTAVSPLFTVKPIPSGWTDGDIGTVGLAGNASYANGTFTVQGAGLGIGTGQATDSFNFVYLPLTGDGTIVARVVSMQGTYTQAGVMIRETLDQAATHAFTAAYGAGLRLFYRTTTGGSPSFEYYGTTSQPFWVKVVRTGSTFNGYTSSDGVNWYQVGTNHTISMAQNVYIGLVVSSNSTTSLATATFDNVSVSSAAAPAPVITTVSATMGSVGSQVAINGSGFGASQNGSLVTINNVPVTIGSWSNTSIVITIPSGATSGYLVVSVAPGMNDSNSVEFEVTTQPLPTSWLDRDVGQVGIDGDATYANGTFSLQAAGQGILSGYGTDSFHFVYQPLSGDGTIVARVVSAPAEAGVMIRETLNDSSTYAMTADYGSSIRMFERTTTDGGGSSQLYSSGTPPFWVKVVRTGSTFNGYTSTDGVTWTQIGTSQTISMAQNVYAGLAASSGNTSALGTATFDNVTLSVGTSPFVTGVSPGLGPTGTSVTIAGSNFGATQGTSTVSFGGVQATSITSWSSTQIVAVVPGAAPAGPGLVTVTVNSISSPSSVTFNVIKPAISSITPPAAQVGGTVTLNGSGFGSSQASSTIQFNGIAASANSWSDTSVTVTVPANATTGPVTVTEDGVTSNGVQFTVSQPLTVTGISPNSGPIGTTVTITGTGFGATQSNSTLNFYGATATAISSWSDTQIVATVPSGIATGPAWVTVANISGIGPTFALTTTVHLTDSLGNSTTYTSVEAGGVWVPSTSQGSGCSSCTLRGTISSTYDSQGHVLSRTDENGHTTTYTYDSNGNVASVTVPTGSGNATTSYTYNSFGEVLTTTDPLGNVTTNTYDANGNVLTVTTPAPNGSTAASVTTFTYDSKGELLTIKDPLNNVTTLTYYATGLINTITDAQNNVTTYAYDTHGNRTSVKDANNQTTTFAYDTGDRLKTITYPGSTGTTTFGYDYRGRRTSVTDQNNKTTTYTYDDADRLLTVTDAAAPGNVTTYGYDTEDNLTSIKDANNRTTSFTYDAFGRVTKTTFPSGYIETYGYDAVGNLTSKTDRKNQLITYTYDQLNRLTQKTYPDNSTVNYTYDNDSRLTQVTDPTGTYQFTFDNMGRLTNTTTSYAFLTGRNFTASYSYDAASNRTGFTDPESGSTSYVYDTLNRLQTLTPPAAFSGTGNFGFSYDALSRRTQMTRPNGLKSIYAYDNLSHLLSVLHQSGSTTLDGAAYAVDNTGNRTSRTPQPSGTASNYTYDNIYELTGVTQNSTTTESYTYDAVGNRLSSLGVSPYSVNTSNELTSIPSTTYTYDNNGNTSTKVVGSNTTSYAWDFENRLTSVTLPGSGGTVTFKYDPFGRRIYKSSSSGTSIYAYDGDNLIEETNSSGGVVARYSQTTEVDEPLAMLRGGTTSYYEQDGLDSVTSLSNAAGALAQTYTFDSFGKQTASSGSLVNPFQYTARELDSETNLYFYRARYYDFAVGRFLSEDPLAFDAGLNFYNYVNGNPTNLADPFGLYTYKPPKPGKPPIPPVSPKLDKFLKCLETCIQGSPTTITVTATTPLPGEPHADPGHAAGTTVDIKPVDMSKSWFWCCAGKCGGAWGLDEGPGGLKFPTSQGFSYHIQLVPPRHPSPKAPNSIPQTPDCKPGCSRDSR